MTIQKEIAGILIFFLVVFSAVSLLTYSPADPSLHHVVDSGDVQNYFGLAGAYLAGLLVGLFGIGAFWIPVLLFLTCIRFYTYGSRVSPWLAASGGILLVIASGALAALFQDSYVIFNTEYAAGGMLGQPVMAIFQRYANPKGALVILLLILAIGFIMTTGISLVVAGRNGAWLAKLGILRISQWLRRCLQYLRRLRLPRLPKRRALPQKTKRSGNSAKSGDPLDTPPEKQTSSAASSQVKIKNPAPRSVSAVAPKQQVFDSMKLQEGFQLPSLSFLEETEKVAGDIDHEYLQEQSRLLEKKLQDFGVHGNVTEVLPGPVITRYEFAPAPGVKINKIVNLSDDLALALKALSVRIIAPIPG
ncbi:MAG: DNA translocase FtsK 4TM domain-containing protein, partial [Desulfobacterales bacterium]